MKKLSLFVFLCITNYFVVNSGKESKGERKDRKAKGGIKVKTVKVTSKGQVTLPSELRSKLNIEEGTYLDASILQNGILLKPVRDGNQLVQEYCQKYGKESGNLNEAREILKKVPFSLAERSAALREE